jgi:hypothetical protein
MFLIVSLLCVIKCCHYFLILANALWNPPYICTRLGTCTHNNRSKIILANCLHHSLLVYKIWCHIQKAATSKRLGCNIQNVSKRILVLPTTLEEPAISTAKDILNFLPLHEPALCRAKYTSFLYHGAARCCRTTWYRSRFTLRLLGSIPTASNPSLFIWRSYSHFLLLFSLLLSCSLVESRRHF